MSNFRDIIRDHDEQGKQVSNVASCIIDHELAHKIAHGDSHGFERLETISDEHVASALEFAVDENPEPKHVDNFVGILHENDRLDGVVEEIFKKDEPKNKSSDIDSEQKSESEGKENKSSNISDSVKKAAMQAVTFDRSVSGAAVDVGAGMLAAGFDPTGLRGVQLAANVTVLLLRSAQSHIDQEKRPILYEFVDSVANAGKLASVAAGIASDMTGIGLVSEVVQQTASWIIAEGIDGVTARTKKHLDTAIDKLPEKLKNAIGNVTPEESQACLEKVEKSAKQESQLPSHKIEDHAL